MYVLVSTILQNCIFWLVGNTGIEGHWRCLKLFTFVSFTFQNQEMSAVTKRKGRVFIYNGYEYIRTSHISVHGEAIWACKNRTGCNVRIRTTGQPGEEIVSFFIDL